MDDLKKMKDEELVNMICGISAGDNPFITVEQVRDEIFARLRLTMEE